jgi:hypothetical protein
LIFMPSIINTFLPCVLFSVCKVTADAPLFMCMHRSYGSPHLGHDFISSDVFSPPRFHSVVWNFWDRPNFS